MALKNSSRFIFSKDKCVNLFVFVPLIILVYIPMCLIFVLPMHLLRFLVKLMAKLFRPDLGNIVPCNSAYFAHATNKAHDTRFVITVAAIFGGTLDFEQFKQILTELLQTKNANDELQYPELTQFPTSWMGYLFWKWDTNFHLDNHVHLIKSKTSIITKNELENIKSRLINEPFKPDQSPWNFTIVKNLSTGEHGRVEVENRNSALILKMSHIIGDGYSVIKLFERLCNVAKNKKINMTYPDIKKGIGEKIFFPFKSIYVMGEIMRNSVKSYPLMVTKQRFSNDLQVSDSVSVDDIKGIKSDLKVSFTSVVIALATGSIRALLIKSGLNLPNTIPCAIPIPRRGHPSTLGNHFCATIINLPIGEQDPIKRVRLCHQEYKNIKSSPQPILSIIESLQYGGVVSTVGRQVCPLQSVPVFLTYLPLDWSENTLTGCNLTSALCCLTPYGSIGLSLGVVSFKNHLIFSALTDSGIWLWPEKMASSFGNFIQDELNMLKDSLII